MPNRSAKSVICGVVCECGPNSEPLACGFPKGHEGAHAWASLPTWTERWRIVHQPGGSMAIEGPHCGSQVVYGVAMDRGVPLHERAVESPTAVEEDGRLRDALVHVRRARAAGQEIGGGIINLRFAEELLTAVAESSKDQEA